MINEFFKENDDILKMIEPNFLGTILVKSKKEVVRTQDHKKEVINQLNADHMQKLQAAIYNIIVKRQVMW